MRTHSILLLTLLCLSVFAQMNSCPGFYDKDLLESGKTTFMKSRSGRELTYQNPVSFAIPSGKQLEVAASAGTIGDYDPSNKGFSFDISGRRKPGQNQVQITLIVNSQGWTSIQVSYLVSCRDDFAVGNYQSAINSWIRTSNSDVYDINYNVPKTLPNNDYTVAAFISGFSTTDNQFQISINQRSFNPQTRILKITIFCSATPRPSSLTISYIIYPKTHQTLDIFYGAPMGDIGSYQISGPTSFPTSNNLQYNQFRVGNRYLACTGNQCDGICTLRETCINNGGNAYEGQCIYCTPGVVFQFGLCTRRCKANQVYSNRICKCVNGYTRRGNDCVPAGDICKQNQFNYNGNCRKCPGGSTINDQRNGCNCRNGLTYDINSNTCQDNCGAGEYFDSGAGACLCLSGYGRNNKGVCVQCPSGATSSNSKCICPSSQGYNSATNQCNRNCPSTQFWNGNSCACSGNQIFISGSCRACPSNSNANSAQTTCICTRFGQTYDSNRNQCISSIITCPSGQALFQGKCVCDGFTSFGRCRQCPAGSKPDYAGNTCTCAAGTKFDANQIRCISLCGTNEILINGKCVCIEGYARFNGVCRQCPKSSNPASDDSTCICLSKTALYISQSNLCIECGANSFPNAQKTGCICSTGYRSQGSICVPDIQCQWNQQLVNGDCVCKFGFQQLGDTCVDICGINQYYDGDKCICNEGHAFINGACRRCPSGTAANPAKNTCLCTDPLSFFTLSANSCSKCPTNSLPNNDDTDCNCNPGYTKSGSNCVSTCPSDATPNSQGQCICSGGKIFSAGQCTTPIQCPDRSSFNVSARACVCNVRGQNFIDGVCKTCIENSVWSNGKCVCNTGFFLIGGQCVTCDARSNYNGKDCVCNLGYFGNKDLCTPCHKSCSQCTAAQADKCTACSDISLVLQKGFCTKNSPCGNGFFVDNGGCTKCLDNCIDCTNNFQCKTCSLGFVVKSQTVSGQTIKSCQEVCGDGIKYQQACDDGNTVSGDGCSNKCQEQTGWYCSGGSSNKPSVCKKFVPDQIQLSAKGAVSAGGYVLQGINAKYLPPCMTNDGCPSCFKLLQVNVVDARSPITVIVDFVPSSQYQWTIKYDFQGLFVTSIFKVVIKLNEQFRGCVPDGDYDLQLQLQVDPAFLAKIDVTDSLTLDQISGEESKVPIPNQARRYIGL